MESKGGGKVMLNRSSMLKKIVVFIGFMTISTILMMNYNITAKSKPTKGIDTNGNTWTYNKLVELPLANVRNLKR